MEGGCRATYIHGREPYLSIRKVWNGAIPSVIPESDTTIIDLGGMASEVVI